MNITLSADNQTATITADPDEVVDHTEIILTVREVIEYVPSSENKAYSGAILRFWDKGDGAIWMSIKEITGKALNPEEAISLRNWKNYLDDGLIKN